MRLNMPVFLKEREIAIASGNKNFLVWLDFQIEKYLITKGEGAKLDKIHEIEFLMGDSSIPQEILLNAKNEILGGLL